MKINVLTSTEIIEGNLVDAFRSNIKKLEVHLVEQDDIVDQFIKTGVYQFQLEAILIGLDMDWGCTLYTGITTPEWDEEIYMEEEEYLDLDDKLMVFDVIVSDGKQALHMTAMHEFLIDHTEGEDHS